MAEGDNTNTAAVTLAAASEPKAERKVKVGDTVHLVHHEGSLGGKTRFGVGHAEAEVTKVHHKGKSIDLVVHHDDPEKSLKITKAERDDEGKKLDSWHFPEE